MTNLFHVGDGYFTVGAKFDSRRRYIRKVANVADKTLNMCRGPTIAFTFSNNGGAWRWQCNSATMASNTYGLAAPGTGFNTGLNVTI